jgi:KDO2-lipid IV(A) lauroyltransferase
LEAGLSGKWKSIRHRFELVGVRILKGLPALVPFKLAVRLGGFLGIVAFDLLRIRRAVTLDNLEESLGDRFDEQQRRRIGRRSYINFAKSMVEFASIGRLSAERIRKIVRIEGAENLDLCLGHGRGIVVVTGHFGSWELLGAASVAYGYPVDFLVGEQSNSLVDDLMNDLRREAGIGIIARGIAARGVFSSLKKNRIVALLGDQDARRSGIFVPFMGRPASTFQGAAQFALRMNSPIVCCYIVRLPGERHRAVLLPPIEVDPEAEREGEIRRLTEEHSKALEMAVGHHPDHYFWAHRRWKTKPPEVG